MPNYNEILQQSEVNVRTLGEKINQLDELHDRINELLKQPDAFDVKLKELEGLSESHADSLATATQKYLDGNNLLFTEKLRELSTKTNDLNQEISRLRNIDLDALFQNLQKRFIEQTRTDLETEYKKLDKRSQELQLRNDGLKQEVDRLQNTDFTRLFQILQNAFIEQVRGDLAVELAKFDSKSQDLQKKIDDLKNQVARLEKVDLEKHIASLQKTLSEIFGAVTSINVTLTSLTQSLTSIGQSLGGIQTTVDTYHRELKGSINSFKEAMEVHLNLQDQNAKKNVQFLEGLMKTFEVQNGLLIKETKTNRIIQIVGLSVIALILIYLAFKHP